jgi:hypothetical protein
VQDAEQQMLSADVVVLELQCFAQRQLQRLLGPRRERNVLTRWWRALAPPDLIPHLLGQRPRVHVQRAQHVHREAFVQVDEAEQEVLGTDVVVL